MWNKARRGRIGWWLGAVILTAAFVVWTLVVKLVGVGTVSGTDTAVGLAGLNAWWYHLVGGNQVWRVVSDVLGGVTIAAGLGLLMWQIVLIFKGGIRSLSRDWWCADVALALLAVVYLFFEMVVINYRPHLVNGTADPSYPSSHVMLLITVLPLFVIMLWRYGKPKLRWGITVAVVAVLVLGVVGRALAGVHWFSDIIGGILAGGAIVFWDLALTFNSRVL